MKGGEIHIYSRNQENNTSKYPDIISRIPGSLNEGVWSCVIDAEAVAWDTAKKQILPFQILSTRKRKVCSRVSLLFHHYVYLLHRSFPPIVLPLTSLSFPSSSPHLSSSSLSPVSPPILFPPRMLVYQILKYKFVYLYLISCI